MEDKGSIIAIKFSPDHRVLAVQRGNKSVVSKEVYGSVSKLVKRFCLKNFFKVEFSNHIYGLNFLKSQISNSCLVTLKGLNSIASFSKKLKLLTFEV